MAGPHEPGDIINTDRMLLQSSHITGGSAVGTSIIATGRNEQASDRLTQQSKMQPVNNNGRDDTMKAAFRTSVADDRGKKHIDVSTRRMPVDLALGQSSLKRRRISQAESKKKLASLIRDDGRNK